MLNQYYYYLTCQKLRSVGPVQQKIKLPSPNIFFLRDIVDMTIELIWQH